MAELKETLAATLTPVVDAAVAITERIPGVRWEAGLRLSLAHDVVKNTDGKVAVAVGPGLPIPVSGSVEFGQHREMHSSSTLQAYFLFSSPDAPTVDAPLPLPGGPPIQPTLPGTTDGTPTQPLNQGGDPANG